MAQFWPDSTHHRSRRQGLPDSLRVYALTLGLVTLLIAACDNGDVRRRGGGEDLFADQPAGASNSASPDTDSVLSLSSQLVGASSAGDEADLIVRWRLDADAVPAIQRSTRLVTVLTTTSGEQQVLSRQRVEADATEGEIDLVVPTTTDVETITVGLEGLASGVVDDAPAYATLSLPSVLSAEDTPIEQITNLFATEVPDSYRSAVEDGRRVHRFAVRVEANLDGSDPDSPVKPDGRVSVTGLERTTSQHFIAIEGGVPDPESPVRAEYQQEPVTVFLVMDVSSSITLAGAADELLDAVSRTLLNLAPVARLDLRVFASDVYEIDSLRDLAFDDLTDSGTAFYRALDTALDDAETVTGDVVIIGFTDGRDLASRNFYPAFLSHKQVLDYIQDRLDNVGQAKRELARTRFEAHFVSLGSDVDTAALEQLAEAGQGSHFPSYTNDTVKQAFEHLTQGVRGLYQLEYSSQQLAGDESLVLQVKANGVYSNQVELPTRSGLAPSD